jgi:hypothetical protein
VIVHERRVQVDDGREGVLDARVEDHSSSGYAKHLRDEPAIAGLVVEYIEGAPGVERRRAKAGSEEIAHDEPGARVRLSGVADLDRADVDARVIQALVPPGHDVVHATRRAADVQHLRDERLVVVSERRRRGAMALEDLTEHDQRDGQVVHLPQPAVELHRGLDGPG